MGAQPRRRNPTETPSTSLNRALAGDRGIRWVRAGADNDATKPPCRVLSCSARPARGVFNRLAACLARRLAPLCGDVSVLYDSASGALWPPFMTRPLRFGILGAAKIAPLALLDPAKLGNEARVVAVAARDEQRARRFAQEHAIERVLPSYQALVEDPGIDVVYNPLPMNAHAEWSIKAMRAGKDVLCEKPFAANADQAQEMVRVAAETGRFLVEAFHYRYHPFFDRIVEIVRGELGALKKLEGVFKVAIKDRNDLRHRYDTAGGATMDLGCYPLHWMRHVTGVEPQVVRSKAEEGNPHVDLVMDAELSFAGVPARMLTSMADHEPFYCSLTVEGERGRLYARNPLAPHGGHELRWEAAGKSHEEQVAGDGSTTYRYQLRAFCDAAAGERTLPTMGQDSIANMRLIDAIYRASGLPVRGTPV